MTRYCPPCGAEVEVNEGHCLLGHSVEVAASTGSLADLRAQVEQVFDDAKVRVSVSDPMPPDPSPASVARVTVTAGAKAPVTPAPNMAPATGPTAGPPPPPAPPRPSALDPSDPIAAFAPPPRMDWGPRRTFLRRKPQEF